MKKENEKNTIEKVNMSSQSIDDVNILNLAKLFPNCVREGKVDFEIFKKMFNEESVIENVGAKQIEKYSISWAGKSESIKNMRTESTGTLKRDGKGVNEEETENIFIEGDNLEVLKLLQKRYFNKIKMIYIDPPYNTGKDFVYKDNFKDNVADYYENTGQTDDGVKMTTNTEKNGRFHSDWLTMMYPRLFLARNLLRDDGVIFVSIDDNEVANLRLIMDEIFGEENFVGSFIWKKTENIKMDSKFFSENKDYVLCYKKSNIEEFNKILSTEERYNLEDEKGKYYLRRLDGKNGYTKGLDYIIEFEGKKYYAGGAFEKYKKRQEEGGASKDPRWLWSKNKFEEGLKNNDIVFKENYVYNKVRYDGIAKKPYTDFLNVSSGQSSQKALNDLFDNERIFDHPKPVDLVIELLNMISDKDVDEEIILDFFAGSGTTAHAVMDLNAEDGGNRKYICVQLPEATDENSEAYKAGYKTISQITRERIKRAGKKIMEDKKEKIKERINNLDFGFKSYNLTSSNYRKWENIYNDEENIDERVLAQAKLLTESPLIDNYQEINVVYEILLKEGFDLNSHVEKQDKYYVITEKSFVEDENQNNKDDEKVENIKVEKVRRIYISFAKEIKEDQVEKLSLTEFDIFVCFDSALNDSVKANLCEKKFIKFKVKTI